MKFDLAWLTNRLVQKDTTLAQKANAVTMQMDTMVKTVRRIATELRPGVLDDLGLAASIDWQAREFHESQLDGVTLAAMLVIGGPELWDAWVTDGFTVREPVTPPVGDESFIGPSPEVGEAIYIFGFKKGEVAVAIDTYFDQGGYDTILSIEDLRALAEIVANRL